MQFASHSVADFCSGLNIQQIFSSVEHPQMNGLAEATNKVLLTGLKKRLHIANGSWAEEVGQVLWSYHTTPHSSTDETPYKLVYGSNAVIPVEIGEPTVRTKVFQVGRNSKELWINLDLIEEEREKAHLKEVASKLRAARKYNTKVVPRAMKEGDLVLKRALKDPQAGKLGANWEGPYRVKKEIGKGGYRIEELNGREVPRTWNAANLKFYFN